MRIWMVLMAGWLALNGGLSARGAQDQGATVVYTAENFSGASHNRKITIDLLTQGVLRNGTTNAVFGFPREYQPANGRVSMNLLAGNYSLKVDGINRVWPFPVPDTTNTYSLWDLVNRGLYVLASTNGVQSLTSSNGSVTITPNSTGTVVDLQVIGGGGGVTAGLATNIATKAATDATNGLGYANEATAGLLLPWDWTTFNTKPDFSDIRAATNTVGGVKVGSIEFPAATKVGARTTAGDVSIAIGPDATAVSGASLAIGNITTVDPTGLGANAIGIGNLGTSVGDATVGVGYGFKLYGRYAIGLGEDPEVYADYGMGLGGSTLVGTNHVNSTAIGFNARTTKAHQIMLGTADEEVTAPGTLTALRGVVGDIRADGSPQSINLSAGAARLRTHLYAGGTNSLNIGCFGDSEPWRIYGQIMYYLSDRYGYSGSLGGQCWQNGTGLVPTNAYVGGVGAVDHNTNWFGVHYYLTNAASLTLTNWESSDYSTLASRIEVDWVQNPNGGTWGINIATNNGAFGRLLTVDGAGVYRGVFTNVNLPLSNYKLQVTNITGTNCFVGFGIWNPWTNAPRLSYTYSGGLNLNQILSVATNVSYPILSNLQLKTLIFEMKETTGDITTNEMVTLWPQIETFLSNSFPTADIIYVGVNPQRDFNPEAIWQNSYLRSRALATGKTYWDGYFPMVNYATETNNSWVDDPNAIHPSSDGSVIRAAAFVHDFGLGDYTGYRTRLTAWPDTVLRKQTNTGLVVNGVATVAGLPADYAPALTVENTGTAGEAKNIAMFKGSATSVLPSGSASVLIKQKTGNPNNYASLAFISSNDLNSAFIAQKYIKHDFPQSSEVSIWTANAGEPTAKLTIGSTGEVTIAETVLAKSGSLTGPPPADYGSTLFVNNTGTAAAQKNVGMFKGKVSSVVPLGSANVGFWQATDETNNWMTHTFYTSSGNAAGYMGFKYFSHTPAITAFSVGTANGATPSEAFTVSQHGAATAFGGYFIPTNGPAGWPAIPRYHGEAFWGNSNGVIYILTSVPGSLTWAATNKIAP